MTPVKKCIRIMMRFVCRPGLILAPASLLVRKLSKELGQVIRQHRLAVGLSQEELADASGIHRTHVGFLERGERSSSIDVLVRLALVLGVPASQLVSEAEQLAAEDG